MCSTSHPFKRTFLSSGGGKSCLFMWKDESCHSLMLSPRTTSIADGHKQTQVSIQSFKLLFRNIVENYLQHATLASLAIWERVEELLGPVLLFGNVCRMDENHIFKLQLAEVSILAQPWWVICKSGSQTNFIVVVWWFSDRDF